MNRMLLNSPFLLGFDRLERLAERAGKSTDTYPPYNDDQEGKTFLHHKIANRQFPKSFVLADGIEIAGAALSRGLLTLALVRRTRDRAVKIVRIRSAGVHPADAINNA